MVPSDSSALKVRVTLWCSVCTGRWRFPPPLPLQSQRDSCTETLLKRETLSSGNGQKSNGTRFLQGSSLLVRLLYGSCPFLPFPLVMDQQAQAWLIRIHTLAPGGGRLGDQDAVRVGAPGCSSLRYQDRIHLDCQSFQSRLQPTKTQGIKGTFIWKDLTFFFCSGKDKRLHVHWYKNQSWGWAFDLRYLKYFQRSALAMEFVTLHRGASSLLLFSDMLVFRRRKKYDFYPLDAK